MLPRTNEESLFGQSSMAMELSNAEEKDDLVRLTYSFNAEGLQNQTWYARGRVTISELADAKAMMSVFIIDKNGEELESHEVSLSEVTGEYEPLVIKGGKLPPEAARINLQLSILALRQGGVGMIFWDGAEWVSGTPLQNRSRGGIESITVKSEDSFEVHLAGPFHTYDRLIFSVNGIYIESAGAPVTRLGSFPTIEKGDLLELLVISSATLTTPVMSIIPGD